MEEVLENHWVHQSVLPFLPLHDWFLLPCDVIGELLVAPPCKAVHHLMVMCGEIGAMGLEELQSSGQPLTIEAPILASPGEP